MATAQKIAGYHAEVIGDSGTPVLLSAGGAVTSWSFFPGFADALRDQRVVYIDRPGTGRALDEGAATLPGGAQAVAEVLRAAGCAPAVVVGQSLGGALAVELAIDHPDVVAGLMLIDPTPFNAPDVIRQTLRLLRVMTAVTGLPVVGSAFHRLLWASQVRGMKSANEETAAVLTSMATRAALAETAGSITTLLEDGASLTARLHRLDIPVVLLSADRKPGHKVRRAHDRLIAAIGGRIETWPDAIHAEHLRCPDKVIDLVHELVAQVGKPA